MLSHTMDVPNGKFAFIESVNPEVCRRMHYYSIYQIGKIFITAVKPNDTTPQPVTLVGELGDDGYCSGGSNSDPYGSWTNVAVQATIKITLADYTARVVLDNDKVHLRSGVTCKLSARRCTDIDGGHTFWTPVPKDTCKTSEYNILFEGYANRMLDSFTDNPQIIYSFLSDDTVFALSDKGTFNLCGRTLIRTEHPRLLIFETQPGTEVFKPQSDSANLDIFIYMNTKIVYVERHIRAQASDLYRDILLQQCEIEKKMLRNALAIATQSPDIFAYHITQGPGHMAFLAGEVIHIIKCLPVEVKLAHTNKCYTHLPVTRNNQTYFLTPQTHILLEQGTEVSCNAFAPAMYLLQDSWYKLMPGPVDTKPPTMMKPFTKPTWKYISPGSLATNGIYSQKDLKDLRNYIMFPAERPALLNTIARGIMGQTISINGGSISNLFDEAAIEKIAATAWDKFWNKFLIFGNISAGFIGIYLLLRFCKLILDTVMHGYALHTVYGWSVYLIGALWDSLTHLLLHLGTRKNTEKNQATVPPTDNTVITIPERHNPIENREDPKTTYPLLSTERNSAYTLQLQ